QYSHVDHSVPLPVAEQVSVLRGSIFDANYCVGWVRIPCKSTIQSIAVGKFGRLVACLRLSDLDVGKWHGEKGGIVSGSSK
ncbi:hypothetical protein, partial [Burkholderia sp. BCC1047]|uniref:hypothetical protein n=1 Tax=Burkholderia sp. BCC1047 TaxID=2676299 RepID=UPI001ABB8613